MTDIQERKRILSVCNSGSTANPPAAIALPYTGIYEDVINYESVSVIISAASAGTLTLYFAITQLDTNPQTVVFSHQGGQKLYESPMLARYMKIEFTASGTGYLSTYLNPWAAKSSEPVYNLADPSSGHLDIFGRLRVSSLETLIDVKHIRGLGLNQLNVSSAILGGGTQTLDTNAPVVHMSVLALGDKVTRQTRMYVQYQPGKSLLIYMTGRIITNLSNTQVLTRMGYYDDNNGVFFAFNNGVMSVGIRTSTSGSVVDTYIPYSSWNHDAMDGSGPSGITVDWTRTLIYVINLAWLGVGIINYGIIWSGTYYLVHTIYNTLNTTTYTATSNLPIRYCIQSTGGTGQLDMICMSASSEAGYSIRGLPFSVSTGTKTVTITETYLIAIRLKQDLRTIITLDNVSLLCNTGGNIEFTVYRYLESNPLTGETWTPSNSYSSMEYATNGTWTKGTPIQLYRTYISSNDLVARIDLGSIDPIFVTAGVGSGANFVSDCIVLSAKRVTVTGADRDVEASIGWIETI